MKKFYNWLVDLFISHEKQAKGIISQFDKTQNNLANLESKIRVKIEADEKAIAEQQAQVIADKALAARTAKIKTNIANLLGAEGE